MKATSFFNSLKVWMTFIFLAAVLAACSPKKDKISPAPELTIKDATNVTMTAATLVATLTPNDASTTIQFEVAKVGTTNWQLHPVSLNLVGIDVKSNIQVTYDMTGLEPGTDYIVHAKAVSTGNSPVISPDLKFSTIAGHDIDGNAFHQTVIGKQIWMVEALKVTKFRNGDLIPTSTDPVVWWNATTSLVCWYNNDISNKEYGALYNWYVVDDSRKIAPLGWHVPSYEEFQELVTFLGGPFFAGPALMEKGSAHWGTTSVSATNSSGFTAIPGGFYGNLTQGSTQMTFIQKGTHVYYWSNISIMGAAAALDIAATTTANPNSAYKCMFGYSIKCIKDAI